MRNVILILALLAAFPLSGCRGGGDPEPVVGDNPASTNGRTADQALTPEAKARRSNAKGPKGNPW